MKIHNKCTATLLDSMGDDLRVVNAARVSFDKWQDEYKDRDDRLISYLASHAHWTPFSQVMATIRIDAPIFVARQWFKHQVGVTRNEMSRRYVDSEPEFYIPDVFHARPEGGIKQGAGEVHPDSSAFKVGAVSVSENALFDYQCRINNGMAPEEARMFLPQNTMTQWVETGSLAYYARVCKQRLDTHAQKAIQQLAAGVSDIIEPIAPRSWSALMEERV